MPESPPIRRLTVIVPCRNEREHVEAFCSAALGQALPPGWAMQVLIADGQSDDGTREILQRLGDADPRLRCIDNPQRFVSSGLNLALAQADGEVIVRMDVHTGYADDYIAQCIAALAETGADNVGGPWHAQADANAGPMQQAIAAAFQSRWVAGGALSRRLDHDGWVDTVYLGCWPRASFERFGGFDEALVRNQDDEHNLRIVRGGGRIWQSSRIHSVYRPRAALAQVFRQHFQYGYWKPFVMKKHGQAAALRHLVPAAFVAALALLALLAMAGGPRWPLAAVLGAYGAALIGLTASVAGQGSARRASVLLRVPAVIVAYHVGYGLGSLAGAWDAWRHGRGRPSSAGLTR